MLLLLLLVLHFSPQRALSIMLPFLRDLGSFRLLWYPVGTQILGAGLVRGMVLFAPTFSDLRLLNCLNSYTNIF